MTYKKNDKIMLKMDETVIYGTLVEDMEARYMNLRIEGSTMSNSLDPREWQITLIEPAGEPIPTTLGSIIESGCGNEYVLARENYWLCIKGTGATRGMSYRGEQIARPIKTLYIHD